MIGELHVRCVERLETPQHYSDECWTLFEFHSNWGDHCGMVARACKENGKSVVTHRTPYGLKEADWRKGLDLYKKAHAE